VSARSNVRSLAALFAAGVAGGAVTLVAASALGVGSKTTTVQRVEPAVGGSSPTAFETVRPGKALTINEIFRRDAPAVVQVTSTQIVRVPSDPFFDFGFPQTQKEKALGSGFVIDKAGHIVTNYHVVAGAQSLEVSFSNSDNLKARIVGVDPSTDIAVLQIDARSRALAPLRFANSDSVRVGDSVVAIGNPLGYDRSVTAGIVSAVQRAISAPNQYPIDHVIQTDAPINQGNSGGPLINSRGEVIGVNAQIATGSTGGGNIGIGFAIPANTVRTTVAQLIKKGRVDHAFIGITAKAVTPSIAKLFRLPANHGLLVATVDPRSGAAAAGLRAGTQTVQVVSGESWPIGGDLIVSADGVALHSIDQLRDIIAAKHPGDSLSLVVYRGNDKLPLDVKLGRQPSPG
jgi:2-alkenal reductase